MMKRLLAYVSFVTEGLMMKLSSVLIVFGLLGLVGEGVDFYNHSGFDYGHVPFLPSVVFFLFGGCMKWMEQNGFPSSARDRVNTPNKSE